MGAEGQKLHLRWNCPPDRGGTWSRVSGWRWHGCVSTWEVCWRPRVGVVMCCWVSLRGCMCFKLPARCVSSQKHQPRHLRVQRCGDTCPSTPTCLSAQVLPLPGHWPRGCPLHPKTPGDPSHVCAGDEAAVSPSQRGSPSPSRPLLGLPSRTDGFSAAPGRSLHPHVRLLFVSLLAARQPHPVPPAPPPPAPPSAAPTGASHTHK